MAAVFLAARTTLARSSSSLERIKWVFAMIEVGSVSCCSNPEALVVIAAVPLCQVEVLESCFTQGAFCGGALADFTSETFNNLSGLLDEYDCEQAAYEALPLRCASLMGCQDAVALMQEVGHVVL